MEKNKKISTYERGQSLVEMAISLVILLTLLAGAVDFGIALYSYVAIRDAAQEGALYGSIAYAEYETTAEAESEVRNRVRSSSNTPVDLSAFPDEDIIVTPIGGTCEGNGAAIKVEVNYIYRPITPMFPHLLGIEEIPLTASVTNAILQPPCDS